MLSTIDLPRGGTIVETEIGPIQVGMPPETIKDAMNLGIAVPQYYVVPPTRFTTTLGPTMGINVAEFEFPAYCNFFFKHQSLHLIVQNAQVEADIRRVFQETLFGPEVIHIEEDYVPGSIDKADLPDLAKELGCFRVFGDQKISIDMLLSFNHFDAQGLAEIQSSSSSGSSNVVIQIQHLANEQVFVFRDMSRGSSVTVEDTVRIPNVRVPAVLHEEASPFHPPVFGVTVLGNSHGFDPDGNTSGYVLWINHRGIMIDPPPFSSSILAANRIPPTLIDGVIVTHTHADHDAGTFQKILQEGKIMIITTRTIYKSFIRKYSALSGLERSFLENVSTFVPVYIQHRHQIRGASFRFFYSLHSIPCIGFEVTYGDKSIAFSGDHLNDGVKIQSLFNEGTIGRHRRDELLDFPWHCDLILHEAGIPPIHTPMQTLLDLAPEVKAKLYVVHSALKDIPPGQGLSRAPEGVANTLVVPLVSVPENAPALEILDLLRRIDIFATLTLDNAYDLLQMSFRTQYYQGDVIVAKGSLADRFFVIVKGEASLVEHQEEATVVQKRYIVGDYFGNLGPHDEQYSSHHIVASCSSSSTEVLAFSRRDCHWLDDVGVRRGSSGYDDERCQERLDHRVWSQSSVFRYLSVGQRAQLETQLERLEVSTHTRVWTSGEPSTYAIFIESGDFEMLDSESRFTTGAFIGDVDLIMRTQVTLGHHDTYSAKSHAKQDLLKRTSTLVATSPGSSILWKIPHPSLRTFLSKNPGVLLAMKGQVLIK